MSRNGFSIMGLLGGIVLSLAILALSGCASGGGGGGRLFPEENVVAAGFEINWMAAGNGTAYLVEESKNKILKTHSLEDGEQFAFSVSGISSELQFEALFGVKFAEAEFCLYFMREGQGGLISGYASGKGRLFPAENLVGAGFEINWTTTEKGTAFLVEETANRILKTQSLEAAEEFAFSVSGVDSEQQFKLLFGVQFAEADFCLYFVPEGQEGSNR